jgi:hypothetical protein
LAIALAWPCLWFDETFRTWTTLKTIVVGPSARNRIFVIVPLTASIHRCASVVPSGGEI